MSREELYDQIEAYLDGSLEGTSLEAFEKRLKEEPALQKEIMLHSRLHRELGDTAKRQVRERLAQLSEGYAKDLLSGAKPGGQVVAIGIRRWLAVAASILLLAGAAWWIYRQANRPAEVIVTPFPEDSLRLTPQPETPETELVEQTQPEQPARTEGIPQIQKEKPGVPAPESRPPVEQLAVVDTSTFVPDPVAERLLAAGPGQTPEYTFDLDTRVLSSQQGEWTRLNIDGTLLTAFSPDETPLALSVYTNAPGAISGGSPVIRQTLDFRLVEEGVLAFAVRKKYELRYRLSQKLPKGLYYYRITPEKEEKILYVGKFYVR